MYNVYGAAVMQVRKDCSSLLAGQSLSNQAIMRSNRENKY